MKTMTKKIETRIPVTFQSGESQLLGVLHRPLEKKATAAVVIVHGFASHKIGTNRSWVHLAEQLREAGIITLRFDQRGFGDSEGDFSQLALSDLVEDVENALSFVQEVEGVQRDKIALFGSSLGGAIAVQAAAQTQSVCALALWAPVATGALCLADIFAANPKLALAPDPSTLLSTYRGVRLSSQFQEEFKKLSVLPALSLLKNVPLLHMHGADDTMVSLQHQKAYQAARQDATSESTFIIHPHTQHFLGNEAICSKALQTYVEWFTKQLK